MSGRGLGLALAAAALLLTAAPRPARALEEGFQLVLYPVYAGLTGPFGTPDMGTGMLTTSTGSGVGFGADLLYALGDGWSIRASGTYSIHPGAIFDGRSIGVGHVNAGVTYALDAIRILPSFELAPGFYAHGQADGTTRYEFGIQVGLNLDYLITRRFFAGLMARYHLFVSNVSQFPAYFQIGPRFGLQWP